MHISGLTLPNLLSFVLCEPTLSVLLLNLPLGAPQISNRVAAHGQQRAQRSILHSEGVSSCSYLPWPLIYMSVVKASGSFGAVDGVCICGFHVGFIHIIKLLYTHCSTCLCDLALSWPSLTFTCLHLQHFTPFPKLVLSMYVKTG